MQWCPGHLLPRRLLPPRHWTGRQNRTRRHRSHIRPRHTALALLQSKPCQVAPCWRRISYGGTTKSGDRREGDSMRHTTGIIRDPRKRSWKKRSLFSYHGVTEWTLHSETRLASPSFRCDVASAGNMLMYSMP